MSNNGWILEVVRGRDSGRLYALARGETVLGNALNGQPGIDLAGHEADGPRRMAARQAQLDYSTREVTIRDLESPGGTFVNRRRLLSGQSCPLQPGDVIQLGSVQLKFDTGREAPTPHGTPPPLPPPPPVPPRPIAQTPAAPSPTAARLPAPFLLASGATCRTWDDFLTISAQRWPSMRDELTSGRLSAYLASVGKGGMAPASTARGTADERLDAWLATLPVSRESVPELDVHPQQLAVQVTGGGGVTQRTIRVTNTGYRLLRSSIRVEPAAAADWLKVPAEFSRAPFTTVEQTDVTIEIHIPEPFSGQVTGSLVIDGNGGSQRVEVRLERAASPQALPDATIEESHAVSVDIASAIARQALGLRLLFWTLGAVALRTLVSLGGLIPGAQGGETNASPQLLPSAFLFALVAGTLAARFIARRGGPSDLPAAAVAGGFAGVLIAAFVTAICRSFEPLLGSWITSSAVAQVMAWGVLGAGLAALSSVLIPFREPTAETTP